MLREQLGRHFAGGPEIDHGRVEARLERQRHHDEPAHQRRQIAARGEREQRDGRHGGAAAREREPPAHARAARAGADERCQQRCREHHAERLLAQRHRGAQRARDHRPDRRADAEQRGECREVGELERERRVVEAREERKQQHGRHRDDGRRRMREGAGARAPRKHEDAARHDRLRADHEPAPHGDLGAEDPEQRREQLEGQGAGEEDHVAVEVLAARQPLRDVQQHALFDEVGLEAPHARGGERGHQRPGGDGKRRPGGDRKSSHPTLRRRHVRGLRQATPRFAAERKHPTPRDLRDPGPV